MGGFQTIVKHCFTEKDNTTWCPIRAIFILGSVFYLGGSVHDYVHFMDHAKDWAESFRELLTGGLAVAAKAATESTE